MATMAAPPIVETSGDNMRAFIERVLGDQRGNAVLAVPGGRHADGKPIINRPTWFKYPADLEKMVAFSEANAHQDLYLSPIIYGEKQDARGRPSRDKDNALTSATIYMDSDSCPPEKFRLTPSIHVQTSATHGHDYWLLNEPIPAHEAAEIAHRITTAHKADGSDPTGWSPNKYLRMPTVNLSYGDPFPVTWSETGELYSDLDVAGAYDDVQVDALAPQPDARTAPAVAASSTRPSPIAPEDLRELYDRIPANNLRLTQLLDHEPAVGEKGWRSEQRWALLLELLRAGFEDREAMSIAWHAAASGKWWDDPRGLDGLWLELLKARMQVDAETGRSVPAIEREAKVATKGPALIPDVERKKMAPRSSFIEEYVTWAATRVPVLNRPLHEMNAWTYLSTVYSEAASVWKATGPLHCNLYTVTIAESSSGKSEATRLMNQAVGLVYPHGTPMIGADHSRNAIVERLLEQDGAVALASSDEADETFRTQRDAPWAQGVQQAWTEVYDGEVPQQGRVGKKELRKHDVKALVVMHMVGTPEGLYDVLDRSMFRTGYLVRHIWARGLDIPATAQTMKLGRPAQQRNADTSVVPRYWADRVWRHRALITSGGRELHLTDEAYDRMDDARWTITQAMEALGDKDIFRPLGRRFLDILLKAAGLVTMSDGRKVITRRDVQAALDAGQVWLDTAIEVVGSLAASAFSRSCDEIERFVAGREGREADAQRIYALMKGIRPRDVDEYLDSLVRQGRLEAVTPKAGGSRKYKMKGELAK